MSKVHRTLNRETIKHIKSVTIPYDEIIDVLKQDGEAFLETDEEHPLKIQTVWKAAKRLSSALGKKVRYDRALFRIDEVDALEGYSFSIEQDQLSPNPSKIVS